MLEFIEGLSRRSKWFILLLTDIIIIAAAFYAAFALRFGTITPFFALKASWPMLPMLIAFGSGYAIMLGMPKIKLHAFDIYAVQPIALCASLLVLTAMSLSFVLVVGAPRSVPIIFGMLFFVGSVSSRVLALFLIQQLQNLGQPQTPVIIYGAGSAGIQLASALRQSYGVKLVAFVDDNIVLQKLIIAGLSVHSPAALERLVRSKKVGRILIAMPSITKIRQRAIISQLKYLQCEVQVLPSYVELIEGKGIVESLRPTSPEDLLGRDRLDIDIPDVANAYYDKSILVTGAGGSIGAELCRQVLKFSPAKIVLFEQSELALYEVERNLRPLTEKHNIDLLPILGSVCDAKIVASVIAQQQVQVVLHAAAYKHVPMVEANELAGLQNNVIGTHTLAKASAEAGVERFVLISTDKAVRPTNIMGASKRLAELIIQDIEIRSNDTIFSMVRFGNVLGSSGSVIPLFRDQIAMGGPVTLTHDDVTRFFMAISEAARLVLISGSLATGGEVFVLDMGKSIKIRDLAKRMIEQSGLTVLDSDNPNGDIEIVTTGLRPGEKLFEELLLSDDSLTTPHPKIMRAMETSLSEIEVAKMLKDLRSAIEGNDAKAARDLIKKWVEGYHQPAVQSPSEIERAADAD